MVSDLYFTIFKSEAPILNFFKTNFFNNGKFAES